MFLNYLAGAVSLVLAVSAFVPWLTVWFYSLKGVESIYGLCILVVGLLGVMVSVFQYLSGRNRGRAYIAFSVLSLLCEGLYFRKLAVYGAKLNEMVQLVSDLFGEAVTQKLQQTLGEQWTKVLTKLVQHAGIVNGSVNSMDFIGGGLILAVICAAVLLIVGIMLEATKPQND